LAFLRSERYTLLRRKLKLSEALAFRTPDSVYVASSRAYPLVLPKIADGDEFEVRTVRKEGDIKWQGANIFISELLRRESVGLRQMEDDLFEVYFGATLFWRNRRLSEDLIGHW
jgi:hypothetical protein